MNNKQQQKQEYKSQTRRKRAYSEERKIVDRRSCDVRSRHRQLVRSPSLCGGREDINSVELCVLIGASTARKETSRWRADASCCDLASRNGEVEARTKNALPGDTRGEQRTGHNNQREHLPNAQTTVRRGESKNDGQCGLLWSPLIPTGSDIETLCESTMNKQRSEQQQCRTLRKSLAVAPQNFEKSEMD